MTLPEPHLNLLALSSYSTHTHTHTHMQATNKRSNNNKMTDEQTPFQDLT